MKDKKKKKGGQRAGAGRKPSGRQKEAVTVYTDVSRFGGKEGARMAIYEFLNGQISPTGKSSFVPLEWPKESHEKTKKSIISDLVDPEKKFSPSDRQIKQKAPKEIKRPVVHLNKPMASLEPQEQTKINYSTDSRPKTLDELKKLCPAELEGLDRSKWIATERQKYGI